ncbi:Rieske 2Fe-2S domain-containing protein [Sphingomonas sp. MG17]|uniref:Rieske 2Fe-2S domain-containing protein n=1 Tax=Sphingomonas tagetis TaxID=2949092 RepID=A0A9X2HR90_9SPHN|nr:Rieske 2Fe-2S domain-containing protein [Sphingomonas tagetis]MCP3732124.1 Rieske 2Fe-2S domain-containing protein [Sphingomonas tagetis]
MIDKAKLLCDIEPGAPMHDTVKRYWLPCGLSSDLPEPDSDPKPITLLGQDYVMFRNTVGQVAVMREQCCHRGASLLLGRVEDGGIRCIYHGWKFAPDGTVLEMLNCRNPERFTDKYRQPAFPVREAGGMIWVYLGPAEHEPPFLHWSFFDVPESHVYIGAPMFEANFIQVIESGLDSSHLAILHQAFGSAAVGRDLAPRFEAEETEYGCRYAAIRDVRGADGKMHEVARVTNFQFPSVCAVPGGGGLLYAVPIDNSRTIFYHIFWSMEAPVDKAQRDAFFGLDEYGAKTFGLGREHHGKPGTAMRENNFLQDREAMRRRETFSGLYPVIGEDAAVTASMLRLDAREYESLVPSDIGIVRMRRAMIANCEGVMAGQPARGLGPEMVLGQAQGVIGPDMRWQDLPGMLGESSALPNIDPSNLKKLMGSEPALASAS